MSNLPIIGWREWIELPDLNIRRIKAKIDTGARSSAIHVFDLEEFVKDKSAWIRFKLHPRQRKVVPVHSCEAKILDYREIRSSSGITTRRPVIETTLKILGLNLNIELSLANRDQMGFRMLLGRQAFRQYFLVDPSKSYCNGKLRRIKKSKKYREGTE
jgi:hypothetical protein